VKHSSPFYSKFFTILFLGIAIACVSPGFAQAPAKKGAAKSQQPMFKAIWEPVNVKEDLELMSVHFTSADEGWEPAENTR